MTPTDPIYGFVALAFMAGIAGTLLAGAIWLYATEWLMERLHVTDPLDKYYKK